MLSVVDEDDQENLGASASLSGVSSLRNKMAERLQARAGQNGPGKSLESGESQALDEQDVFLFESNFSKDTSGSPAVGDAQAQATNSPILPYSMNNHPTGKSSKWSMSTAAKSSAGSGGMNGVFFTDQLAATDNLDPISLKYMHNKFDEHLVKTRGDVSVVMRISSNQPLLEKVLIMFQGLADKISTTLHQLD